MLLLADFTLGDLLVSMIALFFLILAVWLFIAVFADIFTRPDLSGWGRAGWVLLIFILPVIGVLIYLIARPPEAEVAARGISGGTRGRLAVPEAVRLPQIRRNAGRRNGGSGS